MTQFLPIPNIYILAVIRSDPSMQMYYDPDDEDTLEEQMMIKAEAFRDPRLEQLSDEEIIDALDLLDRMKDNRHKAHELSDREVQENDR